MQAPVLRSSALLLAVGIGLLSHSSLAYAQTEGSRDLEAYSSYVLTMPKYKKYLAAMVTMAQAAERNPAAVGSAMEGSGELSIAQMVSRFDRVPEVRGAISKAGLTTRDFVLTQGAFLQAGMAYALMNQGNLSPDSVVKTTRVSRANLAFYQKNEAEITRLTKEAEAKAPAMKEEEDESRAAESE
jgi:hypothetical protein